MTPQSKPDEPVTDSSNQKKAVDDSATDAPGNQEHVASRDPRLIPGGPHGTPHDVGMSGLYRETIPSQKDAEHQNEETKAEKPGT